MALSCCWPASNNSRHWLLWLWLTLSPTATAQLYSADEFSPFLPETLLDMLQLLPGVSISGDSDARRIQVSGTPSGQTRLLIDGVALTDQDGSGQSIAASIPAAAVASIQVDGSDLDPLGLGSAIIRVQLHNTDSSSPGGELQTRLTGSQDAAAALRWSTRRQQLQLMHSSSRFDDRQSLFSSHQRWQIDSTDLNARWLWISAKQQTSSDETLTSDVGRLQLRSQQTLPDLTLSNRVTVSAFDQESTSDQQHTQQWQWLGTLASTQGEHRWQLQGEWQREYRRHQDNQQRFRLRDDRFGLTLTDRWQLSRDLRLTLGYRMQSSQQQLRRTHVESLSDSNSNTQWLPFVRLKYQYDNANQVDWQLGQYNQAPTAEQRLAPTDNVISNPQLQPEILNRMQLSWRHSSQASHQWQLRWLRQTWHDSLLAQPLDNGQLQLQNSDEVQQLQGYEWHWQGRHYVWQQPWKLNSSLGFYRWRGRQNRLQPGTDTSNFAQAKVSLVHIASAKLRWALDWQWQSRSQDHSSLLPDAIAPAGYRSAINISWLPVAQWHINARLGYHRPGLMAQTYNTVGQWDWHAGARYRW